MKYFYNFLFFSFAYKPSGIVAYSMGPTAGAFAVSAALPLLVEMGSVPVCKFSHFLKIFSVNVLFYLGRILYWFSVQQ